MNVHAFLLLLAVCGATLQDGEDRAILTVKDIRLFEDEKRTVGFEEISMHPDRYFSFLPDYVPADYNPESVYWAELTFCINDDQNKYVLEFYDQTIDTLTVYLKHESENEFRKIQFGDQFEFDERKFDHKNFQVILNEPGRYLAYAKVSNREYADIRVSIRSLGQFVSYALLEYYLYGIFYGMILIITLYNLLIYTAIRESKYLYYTFYILSVGLFAMSVDGIAYQLLWPESPDWNTVAHGVFLYSLILWAIIFSKKFLMLRSRAPLFNRILNVVLAVRSVIFLYALTWDHRVFSFRSIELIPLMIIFIASIKVYRSGYKPTRFFIVAYGILFLGFIIKALLMYSVLPFEWAVSSQTTQILSYYSLHICFLFEMLFISVALSDRIRIIKENRDRAMRRIVAQQKEKHEIMDRINLELEEKVSARTAELESKNHQLEEANNLLSNQKKEISAINTMLDLDNWKLRNNLKSAQTNRILNKSMRYHEFEQIFPDALSAMRFLAEQKWKDGFTCKRCDNEKFIEDEETFARRCTRCGYNETPTTDTVFHAIKFPLNKALYILYISLSGQQKKSLNELSAEMDLRRNTIWSMKKKIEEYGKNHPAEELNIFRGLELTRLQN